MEETTGFKEITDEVIVDYLKNADGRIQYLVNNYYTSVNLGQSRELVIKSVLAFYLCNCLSADGYGPHNFTHWAVCHYDKHDKQDGNYLSLKHLDENVTKFVNQVADYYTSLPLVEEQEIKNILENGRK